EHRAPDAEGDAPDRPEAGDPAGAPGSFGVLVRHGGAQCHAPPSALQSDRKPGRPQVAPRRSHMRAVRIEQPGSVQGLRLVEVEEPVPGPVEIVVDVRATALNRADYLQVIGRYPLPPGTPPALPATPHPAP